MLWMLKWIYYLDEILSTIQNDVVFDMRTKYTFELNICVWLNKHEYRARRNNFQCLYQFCWHWKGENRWEIVWCIHKVAQSRFKRLHTEQKHLIFNRANWKDNKHTFIPVVYNKLISFRISIRPHCAKKDPCSDRYFMRQRDHAKLQSHRVCVHTSFQLCTVANMLSRFPYNDGSFQFLWMCDMSPAERILFLDINRASSF